MGPGSIHRSFHLIDGFAADATAGRIRALARRPGVVRVEEDFAVGLAMESADRDFGTERARDDFAATGAGVEICVVDTGVDPTHEQLDSKAPIPFKDYVNSQTTA